MLAYILYAYIRCVRYYLYVRMSTADKKSRQWLCKVGWEACCQLWNSSHRPCSIPLLEWIIDCRHGVVPSMHYAWRLSMFSSCVSLIICPYWIYVHPAKFLHLMGRRAVWHLAWPCISLMTCPSLTSAKSHPAMSHAAAAGQSEWSWVYSLSANWVENTTCLYNHLYFMLCVLFSCVLRRLPLCILNMQGLLMLSC